MPIRTGRHDRQGAERDRERTDSPHLAPKPRAAHGRARVRPFVATPPSVADSLIHTAAAVLRAEGGLDEAVLCAIEAQLNGLTAARSRDMGRDARDHRTLRRPTPP